MDWVEGHPTIEDMAALEHNEFVPVLLAAANGRVMVMAKWDAKRGGFRISGYGPHTLGPGDAWCRLPLAPKAFRGVIGAREK